MEQHDMPIFVKLDEYKDIIDILTLIKNKLNDAKIIMDRIQDLKSSEDAEMDVWLSELEDIERKVNFIDHTLFETNA